MKKIYLDYAAATPLDPEVKKTMEPYFSANFFNPSATYLSARIVRQALNNARSTTAQVIGARPAEIIFTGGATEANNLAVQGVARQFAGAGILISSIEHESIVAPAGQFKSSAVRVKQDGVIDIGALKKALTDDIVLISVIYVSNELGTIQPLKDIADLVRETRRQRLAAGNKLPLYFHSDATQAGNYLDLTVARLGVDLMSINGGKIYGPKGSGCLYVKAATKLQPLLFGGGQERGWRSGTENVPGIIGFAESLKKAQQAKPDESKKITALRLQLEEGLAGLGGHINGGKQRAPHLISVTFAGIDSEKLMIQLDEAGIECAIGSACSAADEEPSRVLKAIGLTDDIARSSLRFSLGKLTTGKDIQAVLTALAGLLPAER